MLSSSLAYCSLITVYPFYLCNDIHNIEHICLGHVFMLHLVNLGNLYLTYGGNSKLIQQFVNLSKF